MKLTQLTLIISTFLASSLLLSAPNDNSVVLSLTGIANTQEQRVQNDDNITEDEVNVGGGILVEFAANDNFGIETGALVTERRYELSAGSETIGQKVKRLHIPVLARFWMSDFFSVAAGPFASFQVGDVDTYYQSGEDTLANLSTDAENKTEYGLDGAATLNFAIADKTGIFIEGRYTKILSSDEVEDEVSALTGLKIDL